MKAITTSVPMVNSTVGAHMYAQGFGTWQAQPGEVYTAVIEAVKAGYRLIDCARAYCNQPEIGKALHDLFSQKVVSRKDMFIVSKVWNTDHAPEDVVASTKRTIADLQCGYLDLLLIHFPVAHRHHPDSIDTDNHLSPINPATGGSFMADVPLTTTYAAMEGLVRDGLVRDIGLSNFEKHEIEDILAHCTIKPAALQIEVHPAFPQVALREYCKSKGIAVMAYCPLGIGMGDPNTKGLIHNPKLKKIAEEAYGPDKASVPRLLLQWSSQSGMVCLSKSVNKERIHDNAATPYGGLSDSVMKKIEEFGKTFTGQSGRVGNPDIFRAKKEPFWK